MTKLHASWTPATRSAFLEGLAACGTVTEAVATVGLSPQSAYKQRACDPAFAKAWDAARDIAREVVVEELYSKALHGWTEEVWHRGDLVGERTRHDPRLLARLLERLDRQAERSAPIAARFDEVLAAEAAGRSAADVFAPERWELEERLASAERWQHFAEARHLRALLAADDPQRGPPVRVDLCDDLACAACDDAADYVREDEDADGDPVTYLTEPLALDDDGAPVGCITAAAENAALAADPAWHAHEAELELLRTARHGIVTHQELPPKRSKPAPVAIPPEKWRTDTPQAGVQNRAKRVNQCQPDGSIGSETLPDPASSPVAQSVTRITDTPPPPA